jgi:hypothetical protein
MLVAYRLAGLSALKAYYAGPERGRKAARGKGARRAMEGR